MNNAQTVKHPDYSIGEHLAWEVALHEWRHHQSGAISKPSAEDELEFLASWIQANKDKATLIKTCCICSETIAESTLAKVDPFKCPDDVRRRIQTIKWKEFPR